MPTSAFLISISRKIIKMLIALQEITNKSSFDFKRNLLNLHPKSSDLKLLSVELNQIFLPPHKKFCGKIRLLKENQYNIFSVFSNISLKSAVTSSFVWWEIGM